MNWFLKAFKQYATFSGRAQRSEYWFFILFYIIFYIAANIIDGFIMSNVVLFPVVSVIYSLVMFLPSLAVAVRRLHDTDRSGWWILLSIIPLINIILIIFLVLDSTPGDNRFGSNPKLAA